MTNKELEEYNRLSGIERKQYNFKKEIHPDWNHEKLIAAAKLAQNLDIAVDGGKDIREPEVIRNVLEESKKWLVRFADVGSEVINAFDSVINKLSNMILAGIEWVGEKIGDFFGWLFE